MIIENMEIMMEMDPPQMDESRTMRMTCQKCREPSKYEPKYEMNTYKIRKHECLTDQISKCREPSKYEPKYEMNTYKIRKHECLTDQISFPWTLKGYEQLLDDHRISPKSEPAPEPDLTVQEMNWKNKIFHTEDGDWIYVDAEGKDWAVFKSRAAAEGYAYASNSWRHWKDSYNGDEDEEVVEEPPQPPRLTDLEISRIIAKQALELVRTRIAAKKR